MDLWLWMVNLKIRPGVVMLVWCEIGSWGIETLGKGNDHTWNKLVLTAFIISIHPLARWNASSLSLLPSGQPSKLVNGCNIMTFKASFSQSFQTSFPASHKLSQSWSLVSSLKWELAKERRSGNPNSIAWKPVEEMAKSFWERGVEGGPTETVTKEVEIEAREDQGVECLSIFEEFGGTTEIEVGYERQKSF